MKKEYRVAIHLPSNYRINDLYLLGIHRYLRAFNPPWKILKVYGTKESPVEVMRHCFRTWNPDAFIGDVGRDDLAAEAASYRIPFVNIYGGASYEGICQIGIDNEEIGRNAAQHLFSLGFNNYGFFCTFEGGFPEGRWFGFHSFLAERGIAANRYHPTESYGMSPAV